MIKQFKPKPKPVRNIQAILYTGKNFDEVQAFHPAAVRQTGANASLVSASQKPQGLIVTTAYGTSICPPGQYVCRWEESVEYFVRRPEFMDINMIQLDKDGNEMENDGSHYIGGIAAQAESNDDAEDALDVMEREAKEAEAKEAEEALESEKENKDLSEKVSEDPINLDSEIASGEKTEDRHEAEEAIEGAPEFSPNKEKAKSEEKLEEVAESTEGDPEKNDANPDGSNTETESDVGPEEVSPIEVNPEVPDITESPKKIEIDEESTGSSEEE